MSGPKIAVIGSGISGMAAAYFLSKRGPLQCTVFEADAQLGGHAHTLMHEGIALDTTVVGFHKDAYREFGALVRELGLWDQTRTFRQDLCFHSTRGLDYLVSFQPLTALRHPHLLLKTTRALQKLSRAVVRERQNADLDSMSLEDFLRFTRMTDEEVNFLILPLLHMFFAMDFAALKASPAAFLLEHLYQHKVLHHSSLHSWKSWKKGTVSYISAMARRIRGELWTNSPVRGIARRDGKVLVRSVRGEEIFDGVLIAAPPASALKMLETPTAIESSLLGAWGQKSLEMVLHRDVGVLHHNAADRAFWNPFVRMEDERLTPDRMSCGASYLLHKIQPGAARDLIVSWEPVQPIAADKIIQRRQVQIPQFSKASLAQRSDLPLLNSQGKGIYYAGAYFQLGWHESGVVSAMEAVDRICSDARLGTI